MTKAVPVETLEKLKPIVNMLYLVSEEKDPAKFRELVIASKAALFKVLLEIGFVPIQSGTDVHGVHHEWPISIEEEWEAIK